jgi:hypothetical protein
MTQQTSRTTSGYPFPEPNGERGAQAPETTQQPGQYAGQYPAQYADRQPAPAPAAAHKTRAHAHARTKAAGTGMITVIPYLTIVVCVVAGVYISWHQGSSGGGTGGVIGGFAFLVAAIIRLALPRKLAGFLASRNRVTDVVTLTAFGACLLLLGLLLPR